MTALFHLLAMLTMLHFIFLPVLNTFHDISVNLLPACPIQICNRMPKGFQSVSSFMVMAIYHIRRKLFKILRPASWETRSGKAAT